MPRCKPEPTEVTIQYLIPIYVVVRNEGDGEGPQIVKIVVDDKAEFKDGKGYTPNGDPLPAADPIVDEARRLIETDRSAVWPGWEFGW